MMVVECLRLITDGFCSLAHMWKLWGAVTSVHSGGGVASKGAVYHNVQSPFNERVDISLDDAVFGGVSS